MSRSERYYIVCYNGKNTLDVSHRKDTLHAVRWAGHIRCNLSQGTTHLMCHTGYDTLDVSQICHICHKCVTKDRTH